MAIVQTHVIGETEFVEGVAPEAELLRLLPVHLDPLLLHCGSDRDQMRRGWVRTEQIRLGRARTGQTRSQQAGSGNVRSGWVTYDGRLEYQSYR